MEVTSKPDLYPLVFSYTGDGGKGGTNYLMVQYFRNYIVRPVGSLSAASTVDSLSSSFIRSVNEANTLVPPPYSRATSPDLSFSIHNYAMPRSTSQQACSMLMNDGNQIGNQTVIYRPCSVPDSNLQSTVRLTSAPAGQISESDSMEFNNCPISMYSNTNSVHLNLSQLGGGGSVSDGEGSLVNNGAENSDNLDVISAHNNGSQAPMNTTNNSNNSGNNSQRDDSLNNSALGSLDCIQSDEIENDNDEDYEILLQHNLTHYRNIMKMNRNQKDQQSISFESKESQINEYPKRGHRNYMNSNTDSSVSSLANLGSPASPPRPTSPTFEVREILEQIRQIQSEADNAFFDTLTEGEIREVTSYSPNSSNNLPSVHQSTSLTSNNSFTLNNISLMHKSTTTTPNNNTSYINTLTASDSNSSNNSSMKSNSSSTNKRNSLNSTSNSSHSKNSTKKVITNRDLYLPISNNSHQNFIHTNRSSNNKFVQQNIFNPSSSSHITNNNKKISMRNSMTSNCILNRGRIGNRGWISKSAPTTPAGTCNFPMQFGGIDDSSPLLDEQDEEEHDDDVEQNCLN
uniref:CSON001991 protein n=1 Tax=Culicoides sonorensis TaxID=179676 RepID=A0A336MVP2_CULSO